MSILREQDYTVLIFLTQDTFNFQTFFILILIYDFKIIYGSYKNLKSVPNGLQEKLWCLPKSVWAAVHTAGETSFHIPVTANYHWCTALSYGTATSFQSNAGMAVDRTQMGVISAFGGPLWAHWALTGDISFAEIQEFYLAWVTRSAFKFPLDIPWMHHLTPTWLYISF